MAKSVNPDQTSPIGTVCYGSMLFASILNSPVMLGNYLQQTTSADDIFRCIRFLGALRVKKGKSQKQKTRYNRTTSLKKIKTIFKYLSCVSLVSMYTPFANGHLYKSNILDNVYVYLLGT